MTSKNSTCTICQTPNDTCFAVKEMMFGLRKSFEYVLCRNCKAIYQLDIPQDLSKYYAANYYSLQPAKEASGIELILKRMRGFWLFRNQLFFPGWFVSLLFGKPEFANYFQLLNIRFTDKILDVGSGTGYLIQDLYASGFKNVCGIDPFIQKDILSNNGVHIYKKNLYELDDAFDIIMLHHSFEHMTDHLRVLTKINQLLRKDGKLIIRVPVVNYAWEKFGPHWVQLDAPRHTCVFSEASMQLLAKQAGFNIEHILYDSSAFQFWGSEQYQRDIPLRAENSFAENPKKSIFSKKQILQFEREATELNKTGRGDQACFCLKKISGT
jgi:SAM-dependent methyltransferase